MYSFVLYPLWIAKLARKNTSPLPSSIAQEDLPNVTVVLSTFNGAELLNKRVDNIFQSNYPKNKLNMIVISDGSTDNTTDILLKLESSNSKLRYVHYNQNRGKCYAINQALSLIDGGVVVFCDLRQEFCPEAILTMVTHLQPDDVGAVTGNLIIRESDGAQSDPGIYWQYEKWIRENEGRYNSLLGVTGAIYAAKAESLPPSLPNNTILDDMFIPFHIIKNGQKVQMALDAFAYDVPSSTIGEEFTRKVRTLAGNFQLMTLHPWLNNPFRNPVYFEWMSHKVSRLLVPYALLGVLVSSSLGDGVIFDSVFVSEWVFYLYATVSYLALNRETKMKFGPLCVSFCTLNIAALFAGWKFLFTPVESLWAKH